MTEHGAAAAAPASDAIIVEPAESKTPAFDPRDYDLRWGFNPVNRDKLLNPRDCGIGRVPYGRLFPIVSFSTPREVHSTDDTRPKEELTVIPAAEAVRVLRESLAGEGIQDNLNFGLQTGYIGVSDVGLMAVLSAMLLPRLSRIRQICAELDLPCPIAVVCEGTEDLDFEPRESCPSCWHKWIVSPACEAYAEHVMRVGMPVQERHPVSGDVVDRIVRPSYEDFEQARLFVKTGFTIGLRTLQQQWEKIASELDKSEKSGRHDILDFEHGYRKDLHQARPQDRQINLVDRIVNAKVSDGPAVASGRDPLLEMMAKSQMQTNELLGRIEKKLGGGEPIVAEVTQVVGESSGSEDDEADETSSLAPGARAMQDGE